MSLKTDLLLMATHAQEASRTLASLSQAIKNKALKSMAKALRSKAKVIVSANKLDIALARKKSLSPVFIDRLTLNVKRIVDMAGCLEEIASLADPVGEVIKAWRRPNGLWIHKVRVPIGVIAIIYESRPNVTSDCVGLCFKSGNSVILRGGSESMRTNIAIFETLIGEIKKFDIPEGVVNLVSTVNRKAIDELLGLTGYIDLVMPRGGEALINRVVERSRIPVIKHYKGICHVYVDEWADLNMAEKICYNAKVSRPGVCNAMEAMLVHKDVAARFLAGIGAQFRQAGVEIRGCPLTRRVIKYALPATQADYRTEYLDLIVSVKVVESLQEAIDHINRYGTHHSDTIVTENYENTLTFLNKVDSACVYVNASTRFTDGNQFGLGAEIGISTDKLHARGPMSLEELTTYKYMVFGNGQIRS